MPGVVWRFLELFSADLCGELAWGGEMDSLYIFFLGVGCIYELH